MDDRGRNFRLELSEEFFDNPWVSSNKLTKRFAGKNPNYSVLVIES
jgi:hypothetical protein